MIRPIPIEEVTWRRPDQQGWCLEPDEVDRQALLDPLLTAEALDAIDDEHHADAARREAAEARVRRLREAEPRSLLALARARVAKYGRVWPRLPGDGVRTAVPEWTDGFGL